MALLFYKKDIREKLEILRKEVNKAMSKNKVASGSVSVNNALGKALIVPTLASSDV